MLTLREKGDSYRYHKLALGTSMLEREVILYLRSVERELFCHCDQTGCPLWFANYSADC